MSRLLSRSLTSAGLCLAALLLFSQLAAAAPSGRGPGALEAPGEQIIFKIKDNGDRRSDRAKEALQRVSARLGRELKPLRTLGTGAVVVEIVPGTSSEEVLAELASLPEIEYAEPDLIMHPLFVPNDTRYYEQWPLFDPSGGINMPAAWPIAQGTDVVVAVLDSGYRPHPDLLPNLVPGYDFISSAFMANDGNGRDSDPRDPGDWTSVGECGNNQPPSNRPSSWHGTHVAGTVAAVTDNSSGVAGVAFRSKILPVRVLGKCGGFTSDIADGIVWAAGLPVAGAPANQNPARVINLSLGGPGSCSNTFQQAIDRSRTAGATVVVAAGNSNTDAALFSPAGCRGALTVAATTRQGGRAFYSNFGAPVNVAAPGGDMRFGAGQGVLSLLNSGTTTPAADTFAFSQGTSMAAPHVSGVAALLYGLDPSLTPDKVEPIIVGTARPFPGTCNGCGSGIVDAAAAVATLQTPGCPAGFTSFTGSLSGNGTSRIEPNGTWYSSTSRGTHSGRLNGPGGTNFDLVLLKWNGRSWSEVARSAKAGSAESIDYSGTSGYYAWRIESRSGLGQYTFCLAAPK